MNVKTSKTLSKPPTPPLRNVSAPVKAPDVKIRSGTKNFSYRMPPQLRKDIEANLKLGENVSDVVTLCLASKLPVWMALRERERLENPYAFNAPGVAGVVRPDPQNPPAPVRLMRAAPKAAARKAG